MALDPDGLKDALAAFFADPPVVMVNGVCDVAKSRVECAKKWAEAMSVYAKAVVPASTTVPVACEVLSTALAAAFALPSAASAVDAAFIVFASSVGGGMAGFAATPPTSAPGFAAGMTAKESSHADAAATWATRIDDWMQEGTAVPLPSGSSVSWS
jgi:hypothetical protein